SRRFRQHPQEQRDPDSLRQPARAFPPSVPKGDRCAPGRSPGSGFPLRPFPTRNSSVGGFSPTVAVFGPYSRGGGAGFSPASRHRVALWTFAAKLKKGGTRVNHLIGQAARHGLAAATRLAPLGSPTIASRG